MGSRVIVKKLHLSEVRGTLRLDCLPEGLYSTVGRNSIT
jgi:hypothetical protein